MHNVNIRDYCDLTDREKVISLWEKVFSYSDGYNKPSNSIKKKVAINDHLFFVATINEDR
jgi:hypothetical protein